ncbi:AAA domain-containing protein [Methanocaldococcus sp.]|uniref:AAA domain-containing protein n=1 Tax=Methanocaldococcus sp. TaxID=2152917 RepID=UPI00261F82ED|nr:AAA domain-containing protein [Methanocaldococcus sp.]MCQ6253582.1 AAA domain-containing protein [Methanocaldococcus sp.]
METEKNQFSEVIYISSEWGIIPLIESRLKRRLYGDEYSNHCYILCDWEIEGLENALNNIKNGQNAFEISKSIWKFLKDITLENENTLENEKLKGMYHWFYRGHKTKSFDSYIYTLLKESEWLYDENRVFRKPTELFYPTNENKELLGDNVNYLHSDFVDEYSKSIAEIVGIKINANIYDILDYLKGLSGNDVEFNKILKIYKFIYSEIIKNNNIEKVKDYFSKYPLIYIPKSKKWRKIDEVFWEDESIVFEDLKDYLVKYYKDEEMKLFFEKIGVKVKANISDYINAIIDISENVEAINDKIKKRIQRLYKKIWDDLKLDENLWIEYESELNKLKNGRYWLANKNGEYKFYYINEIVINDHKHYYELFKDKVPFWEFNKEFTKEFGAESLSESIKISIKYGNKEKELSVWTNKLNEIMPEIIKFILSKNEEDEELEDILKKLPKIKIWKTDKIFAEYEIKNKTANDEIESYLDLENRTLYVSSVEDIPDLIGDAFEEYFMKYKINNLREFIKDLMITKNKEKILKKWCKRGINFDIDVKKYFEITDYEDTNEENAINNNIDTNLNEINKEDESKNIEKIEESNKIDNGKIKEYDKTNEIKTDDKKDNDITEIKDLGDNKNNHEGIKPDIGGSNKIYKEYDNYDKLISKRNEKIKKTESLKDKKRLKNKISDKKQKREENYIKDDTNSVECLKSNYECRKITKIQKPIKYYENERNDYINKLIEKLNETLEEFYSSEPYSVDWFKKLIEIELMMSKRKFVSNTLKITFYKVKKISNYLLELSLSNKPVPQFIEDLPNIRIYDENNNLIEFSAISVDKNKVRIKVKSITREPKKITIEIGDLSYLLETLKEIYDSLSYNIKGEILNKLNKIKIIYGPPGTGKTTKIVEDILKIEDLKNKKILFLAPTNKAVDVFVQKIRDVSEGKIEHLKQYQNKAEELINNKLVVRYKSTSNEKIEDLASENINNASIVATTIVKISYDETLQNYNPNILIIDECSMIPLPYIICAILHYDNDNLESIWISGDPNQIQPVGMSEYWREYNIYKMFNDLLEIDMHNITEDYETHFRCGYVRLTKQYRSITPIGELFSRYTYNGILKHYRESEKPDYLSNMTNSNICVVKCDIKEGERLKDVYKIENSPINIYSAILATELALKIKEIFKNQRLKKSIGIISPYKFQSHLIEGLISNQIEDDDIEIYASTVHKFQGEECDIIIVVLNPPNTNNINNNSLLNNKNLLNVAISRARDYLFILLPNVNNISENLIRLYGYIKQLDGGVKIIGSEELEKSLLNGKIIKNISFISTHGKINTYGKDIGVKYEIKLDEINNKNLNSIDVFINK